MKVVDNFVKRQKTMRLPQVFSAFDRCMDLTIGALLQWSPILGEAIHLPLGPERRSKVGWRSAGMKSERI
jgi:hypothetical protein